MFATALIDEVIQRKIATEYITKTLYPSLTEEERVSIVCYTLQLLKEDKTNEEAKQILDSILDRHNRSNKMAMGDHLSSMFTPKHLMLCSFILMNVSASTLEQAMEIYDLKHIATTDLIYHIRQYHYNQDQYLEWLRNTCANNTHDENFELFTLLEPWVSNESIMQRTEAHHDYDILNKELHDLAVKCFHPTIEKLKTYFATSKFDPKSSYTFATNNTDNEWVHFLENKVQNTIKPSIQNIQILCHKLAIHHLSALPEYDALSNEDKIKILWERPFTPDTIHELEKLDISTLLKELISEMEMELQKNQHAGGMDKMLLTKSLLTNTATYSQIQKLTYQEQSIFNNYIFRYITYYNDHSFNKLVIHKLESNTAKELCVIALLQDEIPITAIRFFSEKYPAVIQLIPHIKNKNSTFDADLAKVLEPIIGMPEKQIHHLIQAHKSIMAHSNMNVLYEQLIHPTKNHITSEEIAWTL